ncbi:MAG TPA: O-antigen ligase family protein [Gemmataceae bacterium]
MHYLLIGYMFLFVHRPFEIWPALGEVHLERVYMLVTLLVWALYPGKRWLPNRQHAAYLAFAAAVLACWLMSPWMNQGQLVVENYFKILVFYVLLVTTVHDERKLRDVVLAFLVVMALYMAHSLREYVGGRHTFRMGIARLIGVDSSLGDPNSFGASILFALPLVTVFWHRASGWGRTLLAGYVGLSVLCILLTGSRSSLVGLLVLGMLMTFRSRRAWAWATAGLVACPLVFLALPPSLQTRFETIINPDAGPENARISGYGRIQGLLTGFRLWGKYPVAGVGPGAWRPATHSPIESHNLYGQVLGEMGTLGAVTFGLVVLAFWHNLRQVRKARRYVPPGGDDFPFRLAGAVGVGVFLMLLEGNFGHNLFRFNWLWYGGFLIIAAHCARVRLARTAALVGHRAILYNHRRDLPRPSPLIGALR